VIRPLVFKELREHRWVLLMLWIAGGLALLGLSKVAKDEGSPLVAYRTMVWVFGVLSALILANRLVVREFSGRTQLFLETLPVSRVQIIAVKWLTGAVLLGIPMTIAFAIVLHAAAEKSLLTARFIDLIAIRSASFLLFAYALAFFIGLTGRYRYVLWGALVLTAFAMDSLTQTPVAQLAPLHVGASSMVFERFELPMTDLVITWLAAAFLVAATFVLSLAAEGSLVVALSQRMSPREKVAVTVSVLAILSLVGQMEARKPKPAFKLHDAVIGGSATAPVAIGEADEVSDDAAKTLADRLSADLQGLRTYLSLTAIPTVTVLPEESIDADIFMRATLPNSDGVVLRAALGAERFNEDAFRTYSLEEVLDWFSHSRARQEDRLWLLDGFTQWWSTRDDSARQQQLRLRAAAAWQVLHGEGATIQDELHHWLVAREQLGECLSDGLAWRAASLLTEQLGANRYQELMKELFGTRLPEGGRAPFLEESVSRAWSQSGAPPLPEFADRLQAVLEHEQMQLGGQLKSIDLSHPRFSAVSMGGRVFEVHYDLGQGGTKAAAFAVRYGAISPWATELDRESLARIDANRPGVLPNSFEQGFRIFTAIERRDSQLDCTVRLGAQRWEIQ
jgi:ABC-type transport system involved in multi-copper enzyme maturation permease subunit